MYVINGKRLTFRGKPMRGVDVASFEVLGDVWARDAAHVYWCGRKLAKADRDSFRVISHSCAFDAKRFYCYGLGLHADVKRPPGFEGRGVRALDDGYFLADERVWWNAPLRAVDAAPATFEALGAGYGRDGARVLYKGEPLAGADAASFTVDGQLGRDRDAVYFRGARDATPLPPLGALPESAIALWRELARRAFEVFELQLPNDASSARAAPPPPDALPPHVASLEGDSVVVRFDGGVLRGKLSGFELLAGELWARSRGKLADDTPCLRVLPTRAVGVPASELVDVAALLHAAGHTDEARALLRLALDNGERSGPAQAPRRGASANLDAARDAGYRAARRLGAAAELPRTPTPDGSTTQAAMKWLVAQGWHTSPDLLLRRAVGEWVYDLANNTSGDVARLYDEAGALHVLLDDAQPFVRYAAASGFELIASKLAYKQDEAAASLARALVQRGFNVDLNAARLWEALSLRGDDVGAAAAWDVVRRSTSRLERAPRRHSGLHTDYPDYEYWRLFAHLRIAGALRARGDAASTSRARGHLEAVAQQLPRHIEEDSTWRTGGIMAELLEARARVTDEDRIIEPRFVMHRQYVERRLARTPFEVGALVIEAAGTFTRRGARELAFAHAETPVVAARGVSFGLEYRVTGAPLARQLPTRVTVERPGGRATYTVNSYLGLKNSFTWRFDADDELEPGAWRFTLEVFEGEPAAPMSEALRLGGRLLTSAAHVFDVELDARR